MHINDTPVLPGVRTLRYAPQPGQVEDDHRWLADLQAKVRSRRSGLSGCDNRQKANALRQMSSSPTPAEAKAL